MFRTEPQKAFISMLWADYGFLPYARGNCYLFCGKDSDEVRKLQQMQAHIKDYLLRSQYSFPIEKEQESRVKDHLKALSQHGKAWVRLYLVCLMENDRNLRFRGIIDPLAGRRSGRACAGCGGPYQQRRSTILEGLSFREHRKTEPAGGACVSPAAVGL
jgi:hypothetical protein